MRKITGLLLILALAVSCTFSFVSCAGHEHSYAEGWTFDSNNHWHASTCEHTDAQGDLAAHTYDSDYKCTVCGYTHTHSYESAWSYDADNHWKAATCAHGDVKGELAAHDFDSNGCCTTCGYRPDTQSGEHTHTFANTWSKDDTGHWHAANCGHGVRADFAEHTYRVFGTTYICSVCNYSHIHSYSAGWSADASGHWHDDLCGHGTTVDFAEHTFDADGICTECGYYDETVHTLEEEWSSDAFSHWHACTCGHDFKFDNAAHTYDENYVCTVCGYEHEHTADSSVYDYDFGGHWHVITCGHDVKLGYEAHDFVNGVCQICSYDINNLSNDALAALAIIYSRSNPTKITTDTVQEFGGITLEGKTILTLSQIRGYDVAILEKIQDELRSVEDGGKDEYIREEIVTNHTITQYFEGLGTREVNPINNAAGEWNPDGESFVPAKGAIALDLKLGYIENLNYKDGVLSCNVPGAYTKNVFGIDVGSDVSLTVTTVGGYIREVSLHYAVAADEANNLGETVVVITATYEYDEQIVSFD